MKMYRIGIIGYGGFGKFLRHWWSQLENVEVVAIADHNHHHESSSLKVYPDWKRLLEDPGIDIVSIVTPPAFHAEMACAAMKAGKHVLLEKPIAITEEGANEILRVQKETGMAITVDHMIRFNPIIQQVRKMAQIGIFGELRHATVNNYAQDASLPQSHWFWNELLSGGIFVEHGVHFFDIIHAISGQQPTEVHGSSVARNATQRDRVSAIVKYDNGLIASYYHGFSGPGLFEQTTIHLAFDMARIEIEGWMPLKGRVHAMVTEESKLELEKLPGWNAVQVESLSGHGDDSRPEGWGAEGNPDQPANPPMVFGGVRRDASEILSGTFEIPESKGQVYGQCVQSVLLDLIEKIENSGHELMITAEDAAEALKVAVRASDWLHG